MNSHEFNRYIIERQNGMYDILESSDIVMEFFKLKKKEKLPVYNGDYGNPVSEEEKNEMVEEFEKSVENLIRVVKMALPGCKLPNSDISKSTKKYEGVTVYNLSKNIVDIKPNYKILQSKFKNNPEFRDNDFDDVDGEEMFKAIKKLILDKSGFKKVNYDYLTFEHKKYEQLYFSLNEDYDSMFLNLHVAYKTENSEN